MMPELPVTIAEVRRAAAAVEAAVPRTPTIEAPALSERAGVIAMSAGNHAHGVALHAGYAAAPFWRPSQSWSAVATPRRCLPAGSAAISRPAGSRTRSRSRRSTVWRCAEPSSSLPTGEPRRDIDRGASGAEHRRRGVANRRLRAARRRRRKSAQCRGGRRRGAVAEPAAGDVSSATIALPDNFKGWALGAYHRLRRKQIQSSISTSSYFASTAAATDMPPSALCSASPP
jgi:hypothetical protein